MKPISKRVGALGVAALLVAAPATAATNGAAAATGDAITVSPGSLSASVLVGQSAQQTLTLTNPTDQDATVEIDEAPATTSTGGGISPGMTKAAPSASATAVRTLSTPVTSHALTKATGKKAKPGALVKAAAADGWNSLAPYPTAIMDNAAAVYQGQVYSVGGTDGAQLLAGAARYDSGTDSWSAIASMPDAREKPAAAFIGDKLYVTGGWDGTGAANGSTWSYDPATDGWTALADNADPGAGAGTAVLNGKLYQVGGCGYGCGATDVRVYDPATNSWSDAAPYPEAVSWSSCGAISGKLYCAGGTSDEGGDTASAYLYDPSSDSWAKVASMPESLWASAYTASDGKLVVSGGSGPDGVTNAGFVYDAASDSWIDLPAAPKPLYRGGSACGLYAVGGSTGQFNAQPDVSSLPGYGGCTADVSWLSESADKINVPAHGSASVTVTFDASKITQPGNFSAALAVISNLPGSTPTVPVSLTVTPPDSWGRLNGNVIGRACDGTFGDLPGATVQVYGTSGKGVPLRSSTTGDFSYWLDSTDSPYTVIVSKDGWRSTLRTVNLVPGNNQNITVGLSPYPNCS